MRIVNKPIISHIISRESEGETEPLTWVNKNADALMTPACCQSFDDFLKGNETLHSINTKKIGKENGLSLFKI